MKRSVVVVIRNNEGKLLLLQRSSGHPMYPLQWCFAGGKLDYISEMTAPEQIGWRWEDYAEAATRECWEELNLRITSFEDRGEWLSDDQFLVKVFHATVEGNPERNFPNREHLQWGWFTQYNLPELDPKSMTATQLRKEFKDMSFVLDTSDHETNT